jgi:ribonucleoside-diphosphate reductase beta chain
MNENQEDTLPYSDDKPVHIVSTQLTELDIDLKKDTVPSLEKNTITINIADLNASEPMLKPDLNRFTVFPIKRHDLWKAYKNHEEAAWTAEELDYSADKIEWEQLSSDEKFFIEHVLAFFAGSDGIIMENINKNFANEVQWPEARAFYAFQSYIEQVHSQVYSTLIDTYVEDSKRKDELFRAIETIPCVKRKADWAMKWMDPEKSTFAERLVAFAVVEGVFFSGSFCSIFWLKSRGIMVSGLGKSNELIARDENLHCEFAITLYNYLNNKLTKERIWEIFREAVEIESQFITESIPCKLIGMNSTLLIRYIKFIANFWMHKLISSTGRKCPNYYTAKNPFSFMDANAIDGKTNFFEQRVTEYRKANSNVVENAKIFTDLNDDF